MLSVVPLTASTPQRWRGEAGGGGRDEAGAPLGEEGSAGHRTPGQRLLRAADPRSAPPTADEPRVWGEHIVGRGCPATSFRGTGAVWEKGRRGARPVTAVTRSWS